MIYAANILLGKIKKAPESTGKKGVKTKTVKRVIKNPDGEQQEMEVQVPNDDAENKAAVEKAAEAAAKARSDRIDQEREWQQVRAARQGATREEREQAVAVAKEKRLENAKSKRAEREAAAKLVPKFTEVQKLIMQQIEDLKKQRKLKIEIKSGVDTDIRAIDEKHKRIRAENRRNPDQKIPISEKDMEHLRQIREESKALNKEIQDYETQIKELENKLKKSNNTDTFTILRSTTPIIFSPIQSIIHGAQRAF